MRWAPVIVSFDLYSDFFGYAGPEVYHRTSVPGDPGLHFMLLVGYDEVRQCWIVRNQYGPGWGIGGYALIGYGECNIDVYPKLGIVDTNPDPWTKRRLHAGNTFESGNGPHHRNLEMLRGTAPRVIHLWRGDDTDGFTWHRAATLQSDTDIGAGAGCIGQPACTATTYNRNFEAVYWEGSGRLRHWWMDQVVNLWHDGGRFGPTDVEGFPGFIQSNYGAPGNLEAIVRRRGGLLAHWWREGGAWHDGGTIADRVRMSGPAFVQANVGRRGNFYVVCVTEFGNMQLHWRDNDASGAWAPGEVFGAHVGETPVCMIQGTYGTTNELAAGNFELCVAVGGRVEHWWRDNSALPAELPRADIADPRFRDGVFQLVSAQHIPRVSEPARAQAAVRYDIYSLVSDRATAVADVAAAALDNAALANEPPRRWHRSDVFGHDIRHVWTLLQSSHGFNLELIVETTDGNLQNYVRDGGGWHKGAVINP